MPQVLPPPLSSEKNSEGDFLPLNGTDYVEFYVGNARQSAHYYRSAFGFRLAAYRGPETGTRDRASYVLVQNKIRLVLTTPLRPDHLLQIGSISKSFAVICALQLEAEGALSLDDPLTTHLPWFRVGGGHGTITLRHLMMHRSGLPMGSDPGPSSLGLVAELAAAETEWEPGERFWYSNIGYDALGFALEAAAGVPFPEVVSRRVLEPLGMRSSVAHIAAADRSRLADPHDGLHPDRPWHPAFGLVTAPFAPSEGASGSIVSTAGDMARYVRHLLARGPTGFARMTDGVPDDEGEPYGLGLRISQRRGHTVVGHSGGMVGYVAQMLCDMEAGVGAIALSNGPSGASSVAATRRSATLMRATSSSAPNGFVT